MRLCDRPTFQSDGDAIQMHDIIEVVVAVKPINCKLFAPRITSRTTSISGVSSYIPL